MNLATFLAAGALVLVAAAPARADLGGPARVVAGDLLVIGEMLVRLVGVDAPEMDQTCQRGGAEWYCGDAATEALAAVVRDQDVTCRDVVPLSGQTVEARCRVGDVDLGAAMLDEGMAVAGPGADAGYRDLESRARDARRGLWGSEFVTPARWREITGCSCSARKKAFMKNAQVAPTN